MAPASQWPTDGGRFAELSGRAAVRQAVAEADRTARALMAAIVVSGAWMMARSPAVRRAVWLASREAVTTWIPIYLAHEVRQAWRASAGRGRAAAR